MEQNRTAARPARLKKATSRWQLCLPNNSGGRLKMTPRATCSDSSLAALLRTFGVTRLFWHGRQRQILSSFLKTPNRRAFLVSQCTAGSEQKIPLMDIVCACDGRKLKATLQRVGGDFCRRSVSSLAASPPPPSSGVGDPSKKSNYSWLSRILRTPRSAWAGMPNYLCASRERAEDDDGWLLLSSVLVDPFKKRRGTKTQHQLKHLQSGLPLLKCGLREMESRTGACSESFCCFTSTKSEEFDDIWLTVLEHLLSCNEDSIVM